MSTALNETVESEIIDAFVTLNSQDNSPLDKERVSLRCYGAFNNAYVLFVDVSG